MSIEEDRLKIWAGAEEEKALRVINFMVEIPNEIWDKLRGNTKREDFAPRFIKQLINHVRWEVVRQAREQQSLENYEIDIEEELSRHTRVPEVHHIIGDQEVHDARGLSHPLPPLPDFYRSQGIPEHAFQIAEEDLFIKDLCSSVLKGVRKIFKRKKKNV